MALLEGRKDPLKCKKPVIKLSQVLGTSLKIR